MLGELEFELDVEVGSNSLAGRGMCQRLCTGRIRHLDIWYPWVKQELRKKHFRLVKLDTATNAVDAGAKYVEPEGILRLITDMGMRFVGGGQHRGQSFVVESQRRRVSRRFGRQTPCWRPGIRPAGRSRRPMAHGDAREVCLEPPGCRSSSVRRFVRRVSRD